MNARVHPPVHSANHAPSYYAASANRQLQYPPLGGEVKVDVCVVGGGFSGLNTAIELAERGLSVPADTMSAALYLNRELGGVQ